MFDNLCSPAIPMSMDNEQIVRVSAMITLLWEVTGLYEESQREWINDRCEHQRSQWRKRLSLTEQGRAYETVSPKKTQSMHSEQALSDMIEKQRPQAIVMMMTGKEAPKMPAGLADKDHEGFHGILPLVRKQPLF